MTQPGHASGTPPDAELLEFIAQWGEAAALFDGPEDNAGTNDNHPTPAPKKAQNVQAEDADETR